MKSRFRTRRGFTLIELLLIVAVVALFAVVLLPIVHRERERGYRQSCMASLKQLSLGLQIYAMDYDSRYPLAEMSGSAHRGVFAGYGWAYSLLPYVRPGGALMFQCPAEPTKANPNTRRGQVASNSDIQLEPNWGGPDPMRSGYTDYWFNRNLSGAHFDWKKQNAIFVLLGDGNDGQERTDARYSLNAMPSAWLTDDDSPAKRHLGGANYVFADGHMEFILAEQIDRRLKNHGVVFVP